MEKNVKKAYDLAQNEVEEKQIENLKNIIKNLLQKKSDLDGEKDKIEEKIKLIKQDIDDFKAGRLDKVKERHELDKKANEVAPLTITIINDNRREIYPLKPWNWNYQISWGNNPIYFPSVGLTNNCLSGIATSNFSTGSYLVTSTTGNANVINL